MRNNMAVMDKSGDTKYYWNADNEFEVKAAKKIFKTLCAHPEMNCPVQDTMLSQKIMLELNEQHFLSIANERNYTI